MKIRTIAFLFISHLAIGGFGFALGIYALPILIAPPAPTEVQIQEMSANAIYTAEFKRELADSDNFHWGEGEVKITPSVVTFSGELAPGPDDKLYLSPKFVETEAEFNQLKSSMVRIGDVKTFDNFAVSLPEAIELEDYNTVIVWCETFGEFITSGQYR